MKITRVFFLLSLLSVTSCAEQSMGGCCDYDNSDIALFSQSKAPVLIARLDVNHLQWASNEYISGGQIIVHRGSVISINGLELTGLITNDPSNEKSVIDLKYMRHGLVLPDKAAELVTVKKWFEIRKSNKVDIACPPEGCPITIEGELIISTLSPDNSLHHRTIPLSTANFLLEKESSSSTTP